MATSSATRDFKYFKYEGANPVAAIPLDQLAETVSQYKDVDGQLKAADGDKEKVVTAWMETADHAEAVKLRKAIEVASNKLRELAEKNAKLINLTPEQKEKLESQKESIKAEVRAGHKAILDILEFVKDDSDGVKKALEEIGDPTRSGRGRKPGEPGSSTKRAYVIATVNGGNLKDATYDTFSKVAQAIAGAEVVDLQKAFAEAAGVSPDDVSKVQKPVEFQFQANGNGPVYTINTVPKETKPRGRKPKDATTNNTETKTEAPAEVAAN